MNFADAHAGNRSRTRASVVAVLGLALGLPDLAETAESPAPAPARDLRQYNLFHPVPADLLREMSTDRPDKTESPYIVDARHFQIEMDLVNYALTENFQLDAGINVGVTPAAPDLNPFAGLAFRF